MGTFFPHHYITYGNRHALVRISENGSIMKSMAMVDFFIVNKAKLQLKQQDIINHTKVGKCINVCVNKNFLPISLHYLWKQTRFRPDSENGSIMKSMAKVDFFIENKDTLWSRFCENGSIMKSMGIVDFFIENKGTFFPYHYITNGNRHALVRISKNGSLMKSMTMVDLFIENKGTFFPYHYITYGNRQRFGPYFCENGSIMKSMAMVDFFIENKGTFFPYHYITNGNRHALVQIGKNGSLMKSMTMVDFFIENKGTFFPYHYITYGNRHALVPDLLKIGR
ncbi:hypothetical protein H6P81_021664 [Aristolochia fimbriata]|uniref:Uncharacterized protein n=1 Tax=Aristolochia fimbriata TaxID=158543 RepID=A0AAV7DPB2_ARIFI|nr:hypothetical protein H6P81_021664 [Aristolochia fimbriata]